MIARGWCRGRNPGGPMIRMLVEGGRWKVEGKSPLVSSEDSFHIPPPAFHNKSAKRFWPMGLGKLRITPIFSSRHKKAMPSRDIA